MSAQVRIPLALAIVLASYACWGALTSRLVHLVYGYSCSQRFLTIACQLPPDLAVRTAAYPALLAFVVLSALVIRWRSRDSAAYPFLMLSAALCGAALSWDIIAMRPVLLGPKIINDTINVLGAVIAASFALLIVLCRTSRLSLTRLAQAAATSYGLTLFSVIAFIELSKTVFGVTELFLLYVIYAFGSFTLHLMTVCGLVARLPIAPAVTSAA